MIGRVKLSASFRIFVVMSGRAVILLWWILLVDCLFVSGQQSGVSGGDEVNILYRNEASGGLQLHSNGLGVQFRRGWHHTGYIKHMVEVELVSMRHPKQYKSPNPYYPDSRPYYFGKLNYAYFLRGGVGRQHVLFSKAERSGVEVRYNYYGGGVLGITKPVYLDVLVDDPYDTLSQFKYIETRRYDPNDPDQQAIENIYGPGPYFKGFGELGVHPGVYGKFSMSFEYSTIQQKITSLEAGVVMDYFPSAIPIMAFNEPQHLFVNFFLALSWGSKW